MPTIWVIMSWTQACGWQPEHACRLIPQLRVLGCPFTFRVLADCLFASCTDPEQLQVTPLFARTIFANSHVPPVTTSSAQSDTLIK
jgi:hypothetical protein